MNTIGIALVWCIVQVTLLGLLAGGLYLFIRQVRPAAAAPVVLAGLATVVVLSLMALSPWPRWSIRDGSLLPLGEGRVVRAVPPEISALPATAVPFNNFPRPTNLRPAPRETQGTGAVDHEATPVGDRSSGIALLCHTFLDEFAKPQAAADAHIWRWPTIVAVVLLGAAAFGLGWLLLGVAAVRQQRLRSEPVRDSAVLELIDVLRAELGCVRPVEVRWSADLVTAATIGWRRPVVLLSSDWSTWTSQQLRAVLAHEIAHARSHDFLALLFGQLGLVLHFYHPLVHWLLNRLRLEQELAADAAAANVSGGQRQYLIAIAELAVRQQGRSLAWPARAFLPTQTTFLRRIAMLRDSEVRFDRLSLTARLATVGTVLSCGLLVAGLRGSSGYGTASAADGTATKSKPSAATNAIVAGVGWKHVRVGMTREELLKTLGQPDNDASSDWLKWASKHMDCTFYVGSEGVSEVRFNQGFEGALANGVKVGARDNILKLYGKPEHTTNGDNGAKQYEYSKKGILFWIYRGHVTQIVVFEPSGTAADQPAAAIRSDANRNAMELKHDHGKAAGKRSFGGSGEMICFTLPGEKGTLKGIRIHGSRYGLPQPPAENFLIYVLSKDMSDILWTETAPYKLFERGGEEWVDVKFKKPREVPNAFWIVLDFKAHQTKGVYVSYDSSTGGKHSKVGLPGQDSKTFADGEWMIRALLSRDGMSSKADANP
jgi:beta-lactamase regulating signal transducer with metallopeptidase domain